MTYAQVQQHPRFKVQTDVDVRFARDDLKTLQTEDISLGGMFVRSDVMCPPGTALIVRVRSPRGAFTVQARVIHALDAHTAAARSHAPGLGLKFDVLPGRAVMTLESLIASIHPPRPSVMGHALNVATERARQTWMVLLGLLLTLQSRVKTAWRSPDALPVTPEEPWYHRVKLPAPPAPQRASQLADLLLMAQELMDRGELDEARQTLLCADTLSPGHADVRSRLTCVTARLAETTRAPHGPFDVM